MRRQEQPGRLPEIISEARRTVGLYRIDNSDLQRMRQEQYGGAQTEDEEKLLAVREYLKGELKIDNETIKRMEIEKMFLLRMDNAECLYVTFKCILPALNSTIFLEAFPRDVDALLLNKAIFQLT